MFRAALEPALFLDILLTPLRFNSIVNAVAVTFQPLPLDKYEHLMYNIIK